MNRHKIRKEEQKAIRHVMAFLESDAEWSSRLEEFLDQMLEPIADQLKWTMDEVTDQLLDGPYASMAYGFLLDEFVGTRWNNEPDSLIDTYLERRGWREAVAGRRYLTTLNKSEANLYEVVAIDQGRSLTLKPYDDSTKLIEAFDHSASELLNVWDCVAGRVLKLHGRYEFAGGLLMLPPDQAKYVGRELDNLTDELTELLQQARSSGEITLSEDQLSEEVRKEVSMNFTEALFKVWGVYICGMRGQEMPELRNTDGELLEMITVRFKATGTKKKIREALNNEPMLDATSNTHWSWLSISPGQAAQKTPSTLLGQITLTDHHVELQVNSRVREEEGCSLLESALSGLIGIPLAVHESLDSLLSNHEPDFLSEDSPQPREMQEIANRLMDDHYRATLDQPIPMLDNKSPRQCAADPALRQRVIEWLKFLENNAGKDGSEYDISWMWDELSLSPTKDY